MFNQVFLQKKYSFSLLALVLGGMFCACSDKMAGTSEETEGIVAIADKEIAGVSQKGPFVTGSSIILKETSSDGSLKPTGKEFYATTRSNKGDFKISNINLESQYALLSAEGYYIREYNNEPSSCSIRLDAVSDLEKRETVNINLLTHFEYKRVLKLVKSGKTFAEAKKQASTEVLAAFGVTAEYTSPEDLNIFNYSDADRVLFNVSRIVDYRPNWNTSREDDAEVCPKLQDFVDEFANDFADDGKLSDSIMVEIVADAYISYTWYADMEYVDEKAIRQKEIADPDEAKDHGLADKKSEYDFSKLVMLHYMDVENCDETLWGEYRKFGKPISTDRDIRESEYILCNGFTWEVATQGRIDSLTLKIEHESGTMTDKRDGRKYKTVSFEYDGQKYEWMAENLLYTDSVVKYSKGADRNERLVGSYSWATAMQLDDKYMEDDPTGELDSIHQGICPDGWHISSNKDWAALIAYVGGYSNLYNENWVSSDRKTALAKGIIGVFSDKFDFNLDPMDPKFLETTYHSYSLNRAALYDSAKHGYYDYFDDEGAFLPLDFFELELSFREARAAGTDRYEKGYVRCVKN